MRRRCDLVACHLRAHWRLAMAMATLPVLTLWLHGQALNYWWCCDDSQLLWFLQRYTPLDYLVQPAAWQALIPFSYTPWLALVQQLDVWLFGYAPLAMHAHLLLSVALCAVLLLLLLRPWCGLLPAWAAALLFLLGSPTAVAAQQLMVRHYVDGLLFMLLALLLLRPQGTAPGPRGWRYGLSCLAYALALMSKEIFVPLALLPLLLPLGSLRRRVRLCLPWLLLALLFLLWRGYMLGAAVGGYTPNQGYTLAGFMSLLPQLGGIPALLWSSPGWALAALAGLLLLALQQQAGGRQRCALLLRLASALVLLLVPLLPLLFYPGLGPGSERYYILAWATLAAVAAWLAASAGQGVRRWLAAGLLLSVALPAWQQQTRLMASLDAWQQTHRLQGQALLQAGPEAVVWASSDVASWFNSGLLALAPSLAAGDPAHLIADEMELIDRHRPGQPLLRQLHGQPAMRDVAAQREALLSAWRQQLRAWPMRARFVVDVAAREVSWQVALAASDDYTWSADEWSLSILGPGSRQPVPLSGQVRVAQPLHGCFRALLTSRRGERVYGPAMYWPQSGRHVLVWQGRGELFSAGTASCPTAASASSSSAAS